MKTDIYLNSREGLFQAKGIYTPEQTIVLKGSVIKTAFSTSEKFKGSDLVLSIRNDRAIVDDKGVLLKDYSFASPSTAAQFVTGRSSNGYVAWRVDEHTSLKRFVGK